MKPGLAAIFGDNMIFQCNTPVPIWGKAAPNERVTISFGGQQKCTTADETGRWRVDLDPLSACAEPEKLTAETASFGRLEFHNILVGEVWLCSGQSNMQWTVAQSANAAENIASADYPLIRHTCIPRQTIVDSDGDLQMNAAWEVCSPATVHAFTAVGYYYAVQLQKRLGVPVGLINASWGGTAIEAWISRDALCADAELNRNVIQESEICAAKQRDEIDTWWKNTAALEDLTSDRTNDGLAKGWALPDTPSDEWKTMRLPAAWQETPGMEFSGIVWFRRDITISAAWSGNDVILSLGACDKGDITYWNGVQVGSVTLAERQDSWSFQRQYRVPSHLVRPGLNTVAVRIHSCRNAGGMMGPAHAMRVFPACDITGQNAIMLSGEWNYAVEKNYGSIIRPTNPPYGPDSPNWPGNLFVGMIAPIIPYGLRGALWYQGESNVGRANQYRQLMAALIDDWRRRWNAGAFPFYFAQLANFMQKTEEPLESSWAALREAQASALSLPDTGMAVLIDIGEADNIHPNNKQDVGARLALIALAKMYCVPDVCHAGPTLRTWRQDGAELRLFFDSAEGGLKCRGETLSGFALAGEDKKFRHAMARQENGAQVVLSHPEIARPVAVRYAWAENPDANLYNAAGLPAAPFRTDTWPVV